MTISGLAPRWASPPGETIAAAAAERDLSRTDLASGLGLSVAQLESLLVGKMPITPTVAQQLSATLGASREFWITREAQYRDDVERVDADQWAQQFPVAQMADFGWIKKPVDWHDQITVCLNFFDVDGPHSWTRRYENTLQTAHYRKSASFTSSSGATTAWFRACEAHVDGRTLASYDAERFAAALPELRDLTTLADPRQFLPQLSALCADAGVAVAVVRAPAHCPVSGVARWYGHNPLIQLSARHLSDDHFWFSLFHEAGHVLLHDLNKVYIDSFDDAADDGLEEEANLFAQRHLVPEGISIQGRVGVRGIIRAARANGVSRGIIVGQLQHRQRVTHAQFNDLKNRYQWVGSTLEMKRT
ncbi:ImmA/IrrE family metallo-endopeptidase [Gordonia sputi]